MSMSAQVTDPVCGRTLDCETAPIELMNVDGDRVFFCSVRCAAEFKEHPEVYTDPEFHEATEEARRSADALGTVGYVGPDSRL